MSDSSLDPCSRVLVIDDNRAIHEDFKKILSPEKLPQSLLDSEAILFGDLPPAHEEASKPEFRMDSAYQGEEGLGLVQKAVEEQKRYALAFVDVRMPPGWDGVETATRLWQADPDLYIVICTAYSDYAWGEMVRKLGHLDQLLILKKPFDTAEVTQLATSLTKRWLLLQEFKARMVSLEKNVARFSAEVHREQEQFKAIFENSPEGIFQSTWDGRILCANPALAEIYGYGSPLDFVEQVTDVSRQLYISPERRAEFLRELESSKVVRNFEAEVKCKDGSHKWVAITASKLVSQADSRSFIQGFVIDITQQKNTKRESDLMEIQLRQSQKLESVGQLAAGIAHEINTPIQYVGDNLRFLEGAFADLSKLVLAYQTAAGAVASDTPAAPALASAEAVAKEVDLEYLKSEIPLAIRQALDGVNRVANIVRAMKEFSHPGSKEKVPVDLNHAIETTLTVARNEWKYVAEVKTDFAPDLPMVLCFPDEFNQVILNLVVNAAQAIADVVGKSGDKGTITISTKLEGPWVEIRVHDTGTGIPEEIRHRIFEPFFTTKAVGKGTGQGLAMARAAITKKHGGELFFDSTAGKGTTFTIRLPVSAPAKP